MFIINKLNTYLNNRYFNSKFIKTLKIKGISTIRERKNWHFFFPEEVRIRPSPSSDFSVFLQVFYHQQYAQIIDLALLNNIKITTIFDLGANVGFTSIYFEKEIKDAKIFALEPNADNFIQLTKNTKEFKNIIPLNLAIWGHETQLELLNLNAEDWAKSYKENLKGDQGIKALTISQLINQYKLNTIDILKIDVEGAEDEIFKADVSFLNQTKLIALEIHDDKTDRNMIYGILKAHHFLIWSYSELTIGINKKLIL
jgi:FkbM family methyltransferase